MGPQVTENLLHKKGHHHSEKAASYLFRKDFTNYTLYRVLILKYGGNNNNKKIWASRNLITPLNIRYRSRHRILKRINSNSWETFKKCLISLAIREMRIKNTSRFHLTSIRMAMINKNTVNAGKDVGMRSIHLFTVTVQLV